METVSVLQDQTRRRHPNPGYCHLFNDRFVSQRRQSPRMRPPTWKNLPPTIRQADTSCTDSHRRVTHEKRKLRGSDRSTVPPLEHPLQPRWHPSTAVGTGHMRWRSINYRTRWLCTLHRLIEGFQRKCHRRSSFISTWKWTWHGIKSHFQWWHPNTDQIRALSKLSTNLQ